MYADWRRSSLGEITEALELRLILRLAGPLQGRSVLDVGCGDGTLALVAARHGAARVAGCDPDPRMIARAAAPGGARRGRRIDLAVARSQALPFPDRSFDVVTCITVLAFVPDAAARDPGNGARPPPRRPAGDRRSRQMEQLGGAPAHPRLVRRGPVARRPVPRRPARLRRWSGARASRSVATNGAIFFPPWTALARRMAPIDPVLGEVTTLGAAFVTVQATKPR